MGGHESQNIPIKTTSIASKAAGVSLLFSVFLASNAIAGSSPQYWQTQGNLKKHENHR